MSSHLVRLASFAAWPSTASVSSLALARSGFKYTGRGESTVCTECQLVVDSWQHGDLPDQVHRQRSPNCAFVREPMQSSDSSILRPAAVSAAVVCSSQNYDVTTSRTPGLTACDSVNGPVNLVADVHSNAASHFPSCTIDRNHPDFDRLKDEQIRLSTFYDWPERVARIVEPRDVAKAGMFYTGQTDRVQCAFCRGYLRNWVQGDVPADEHHKHFPHCRFIGQQKDFRDGLRDVVDSFSPVNNSSSPSRANHTQFQSTASQPQTSADDRPRHRNFASEQRRVESFRGVQVPRGQTVEVLAKAGFFHVGPEDNVRCYYCDGGLKNWQPTDDPWTEHRRWFSRCAHLQTRQNLPQTRTQHVPHNPVPNRSEEHQSLFTPAAASRATSQSNVEYRIEPREIKARLDAPVVQAVMKMGYSRDLIRKVIEQRLVSTGDDFASAHSLLEAVFALEEETSPLRRAENSGAAAAASAPAADTVPIASPAAVPENSATDVAAPAAAEVTNLAAKSQQDAVTSELDVTDNTPPTKPKSKKKKKKSNKNPAAANEACSTDVNDKDASPAPVDVASSVPTTTMLEENEKLKEERTCKVCMDAQVDTVFLPCGHFVCCAECAKQLQRCPICRICISGTVRASIS